MTISRGQPSKSALIPVIAVLLIGLVLTTVWVWFSSAIYVIGGIFGIILAIIFVKKPLLGTYFIIISFPFLSTVPRGAFVPGLKLDEILIILFFGLNILLPAGRRDYRLTQIDIIYLTIFVTGSLLPFIGAFLRNQQPNWIEAVALLKPFILFRIIVMSFGERRQISWAIALLLTGSLLVAMLAGLQILNIAGIRSLLAQIYYDTSAPAVLRGTYNRATSTLGNWNALGGYAALGALLCLSLLRYRRAVNFPLLVPIALAANISTLLLAGSSSSLIGFFIGLLVWWVIGDRPKRMSRGYRIGLSLVFLLVLLIFVVMGKDVIEQQIQRQTQLYVFDRVSQTLYPTYGIPASIVVRWLLANFILRTIIHDQVAMLTGFGTGADSIELLPWGTPESGYMGMLFFYGPLFFFLYLFLYLVIFLMSLKLKSKVDKLDDLGHALTTAIPIVTVAVSFMNIINSYYSAAGVTHYFWILVGSMVVLAKISIAESQGKSPRLEAGST